MRATVFVVTLLAGACAPASDDTGADANGDDTAAPESLQPLRLASFNAQWLGSTYGGGEQPRNQMDYQMVGRLLTDHGIELVGLQEIDGPQAINLLELDGDWEWITGATGWSQNVAIAWRDDRVEVSNVREVELAGFRDPAKKPLVADVRSRSGDLAFSLVVVHHRAFGDDESAQERQAQTVNLHEWIDDKLALSTSSPFDENIVLVGDFNDTFAGINPSFPSLQPFSDDPSWDFATAYTNHYTHISYGSQIDHIALRGDVQGRQVDGGTTQGIHVIPHEQTAPWSDYGGGWNDPSPTVSDHRPLWIGMDHDEQPQNHRRKTGGS